MDYESKRRECRYFETCSAPLCPLDPESLDHGLWYPDEQICKRDNMPGWVKRQRKLKSRIKPGSYFTVPMLSHRCSLRGGTVGLDPDRERADQERDWFKKHREYQQSEKQMAALKKTWSIAAK